MEAEAVDGQLEEAEANEKLTAVASLCIRYHRVVSPHLLPSSN